MVKETYFYTGDFLQKEFGLTNFSEVVFSDFTQRPFYILKDGMRFTKQISFLCSSAIVLDRVAEGDDWIDWDYIEICPWENIIGFESFQGGDLIRSTSEDDIQNWLSNLEDVDLNLPYLSIEKRGIALIIEGRPHSERSKKGSKKVREIVQGFDLRIKSEISKPLKGPLGINIEVFTTDKQNLPDPDRFSIPIMDAFKGIVYEDDKQIVSLHPRIIETQNLFVNLECRSVPMDLPEVDKMPVGSLLPLSKSINDYFVVRVNRL